jgi:hypothetical protein
MAKNVTIIVAAVIVAGSLLGAAWIIASAVSGSPANKPATTSGPDSPSPDREGRRPDKDRGTPQPPPKQRYPLVRGKEGRFYYQIGDYYVCKEAFPDGNFPEGEPTELTDGKRKFTGRLEGKPYEWEEERTLYNFPDGTRVDRFTKDAVIRGERTFVPGEGPPPIHPERYRNAKRDPPPKPEGR